MKPFTAAVDTTCRFVVLGYEGAAEPCYQGVKGIDLKDENTINIRATRASEVGPLLIVAVNMEEAIATVKIIHSIWERQDI